MAPHDFHHPNPAHLTKTCLGAVPTPCVTCRVIHSIIDFRIAKKTIFATNRVATYYYFIIWVYTPYFMAYDNDVLLEDEEITDIDDEADDDDMDDEEEADADEIV